MLTSFQAQLDFKIIKEKERKQKRNAMSVVFHQKRTRTETKDFISVIVSLEIALKTQDRNNKKEITLIISIIFLIWDNPNKI